MREQLAPCRVIEMQTEFVSKPSHSREEKFLCREKFPYYEPTCKNVEELLYLRIFCDFCLPLWGKNAALE